MLCNFQKMANRYLMHIWTVVQYLMSYICKCRLCIVVWRQRLSRQLVVTRPKDSGSEGCKYVQCLGKRNHLLASIYFCRHESEKIISAQRGGCEADGFWSLQQHAYVKRTSNAACIMAACHKKFMTSSDAQVQTHRQTSICNTGISNFLHCKIPQFLQFIPLQSLNICICLKKGRAIITSENGERLCVSVKEAHGFVNYRRNLG